MRSCTAFVGVVFCYVHIYRRLHAHPQGATSMNHKLMSRFTFLVSPAEVRSAERVFEFGVRFSSAFDCEFMNYVCMFSCSLCQVA